jgi:hypothetical protein
MPGFALPLLLGCAALFAGCAARAGGEGLRAQPRLAHMRDAHDLRRLPQNLAVYARHVGKAPLRSEQEQARQDARFDRIFFSPWQKTAPSLTAIILPL